ncbi:hypothetical protein LG296_20165 (plasmid) [Ureibacillus chungkukjangi]|uniref:WapI family immunity protein n=1 Tax=Ureibacillus chungkukjangi TaxID=1202712 RepID=UPI000D367D4D|nr:hypothetical protein [Ureibacillus chungkukjangi]MCM3390638.1 hypothetical protein [Ureibacillus chungkukjangi]
MERFKIGAEPNFIEFGLDIIHGFPNETDVDGGYTVEGSVSIQSGRYGVHKAAVWFTTGQVYQLYHQLKDAFQQLKGIIVFSNRGEDIYFELEFTRLGQIHVNGYFQEYPSIENRLQFEFHLDQSYIPPVLNELKKIVDVYGGMRGIKDK